MRSHNKHRTHKYLTLDTTGTFEETEKLLNLLRHLELNTELCPKPDPIAHILRQTDQDLSNRPNN